MMMKKGLILTVCAAAACGNPDNPLDGYDVSTSSLTFNHSVGDTDCPQDLGDVEVENFSETDPLIFTVAVDDVGAEDLIDFGDADDLSPTSLDDVEFEVEPLGSVIFVPWFNCGQPTSFQTAITITPEDPELDVATIAVSAVIQ
jgi:hypothetical protein